MIVDNPRVAVDKTIPWVSVKIPAFLVKPVRKRLVVRVQEGHILATRVIKRPVAGGYHTKIV